MEVILYLSLLLAVFLLTRAAAPGPKTDCRAMEADQVPERVLSDARQAVPGLRPRKIRVFMDGPGSVRYLVIGVRPGGDQVRLVVQSDGAAHLLDGDYPESILPKDLDCRVSQCLPTFHPARGSVRLVRGQRSAWYEMRGTLGGDQDVSLKISLDGYDLFMTVNGTRI